MHYRKLNREYKLVSILTLVGLLIRLQGIMSRSLWWDEFVSISFANYSFPVEIIRKVYSNVNPPLFYLLLSVWIKVFGSTDLVLRIPPFIFAVASIPLLFIFMKKTINSDAGLVSALFLALNPFHIFYSIEVRMYSAIVFCSLGSIIFFQRWLEKPTRSNAAVLILFNCIGLYMHYFFILIFVAQILYFLTVLRKQYKNFKNWVIVQIITILMFVPWFPAIYHQYKGPDYGHFKRLNWINFVNLLKQISPGTCLNKGHLDSLSWILVIILAVTGIAGIIYNYFKNNKFNAMGLVFYFCVPIICVWLQSISKPAFTQRNMIIIVPFFIGLMVAGIFHFPGKPAKFILVFFVAILSLASDWQIKDWHRDGGLRGDWKQAAIVLRKNFKKNDILLLYPGQHHGWGIRYYCPDIVPVSHVYEAFIKTQEKETNDSLFEKISKLKHFDNTIWLVICSEFAFTRWQEIVELLDQKYHRIKCTKFYNVRLYEYAEKE
ncbi:MAG: hypothetical protein A2161_09850 [Candidatus Schekmanbacteria bacterium RBG_13_48_7]|uniref:Glycosyltransferase RgtA/B/C/D-like domain-containing protein n=1 Tax=Candidatus Schekmanbacteria bacterium RBG_13_48_7 TaxID=1817878 RepID=A0A1F7RY65_9BACT|nr:MAG: hypothetical protein A2161_09850 [Candidatus Schekmanbacteria bacterium RBG_13_48_7]